MIIMRGMQFPTFRHSLSNTSWARDQSYKVISDSRSPTPTSLHAIPNTIVPEFIVIDHRTDIRSISATPAHLPTGSG
jgi:hypothetical protein